MGGLHTERVSSKQVRANSVAQVQNCTGKGKFKSACFEQLIWRKKSLPRNGKVCVYLIDRRNWNVENLVTCSRTCSKKERDFKSSILLYVIIYLFISFLQ